MAKNNTEDYLNDLSFEDLETLIEKKAFTKVGLSSSSYKKDAGGKSALSSQNALSTASNYSVIKKYGTLGSGQFAPVVAKVDWFGYERYDIRRWKSDGSPGKGFTFTYDELLTLYKSLIVFDFNKRFGKPLRFYEGANTTAKIYYKIASLSTSEKKGVTWIKEVNIVDWGYGPKVDFHQWTPKYDRCSKGICISLSELKDLKEIISNIL